MWWPFIGDITDVTDVTASRLFGMLCSRKIDVATTQV